MTLFNPMDYKEKLLNYTKSLYEKSTRHNMNSKYVYKKILSTLSTHTSPITSLSDLKEIKNIGKKTMDLFKSEIFEVKSKEKEEMVKKIKKDDLKKIKEKKKYLPSFRSGAYAILKVLSKTDGLSKPVICHRGNKFSNSNFNFKERNSAWNSMKTLTKKELVFEDSKRYFLTEKGIELCGELFRNDSTLIEETDGCVKLIIDAREMKSRSERLFFQSEFNSRGILNETKCIQMGDFIWTTGEYVLDYIIERKCGSDFCSSISDGRLNEQKKRMMECGISRVFYIVENLREADVEKAGREYVYSHLESLKCENITVIETNDIKETVDVISMIDNQVREDYKNRGHENNLLRFDDYIEKGTKRKNMALMDILCMFLTSVHGLNKEKAVLIANEFGTLSNFFEICKKDRGSEYFKNMEKEKGIKIGKKTITNIMELLFGV